MSDDTIPDRSRLLVFSRFALQQSMKEEPSRKTRTIEFMRFASMRWTLDDFLPARQVERRLQMRVIEHVRALDVVIANIDPSADFSTRNERCAAPSHERVRCVSDNASLNDNERCAAKSRIVGNVQWRCVVSTLHKPSVLSPERVGQQQRTRERPLEGSTAATDGRRFHACVETSMRRGGPGGVEHVVGPSFVRARRASASCCSDFAL